MAGRNRWAGSMLAALELVLAHPTWWAIGLAGFLVRGGILVLLLGLVALPSAAGLATSFAPAIGRAVLGATTAGDIALGTLLVGAVIAALILAGVVGAWLDLALAEEASSDGELEVGWRPGPASAWTALALRLVAHTPTAFAVGYAVVRIVSEAYAELLDPGDAAVPLALRVIARAPDALVLVAVAWLVAEAVGPMAVRRWAAGEGSGAAVRHAAADVLRPRGLATLVLTDAVALGLVVALVAFTMAEWEQLRSAILDGVDDVRLAAALVLLVSSWALGLAILGIALAWRGVAWTAETPVTA